MRIISGTLRNQVLCAPKGSQTRPTSSQLRAAVFNILQDYIEQKSFLDLFAGSGGMGFEAISRGASQAVFVESNRDSAKCIRQNASKLKIESLCTIFEANVFQALKKFAGRQTTFDIIYADPPYESRLGELSFAQHTLELIDSLSLLRPGGIFFLEDAAQTPVFLEDLQNISLLNKRKMGRSILYQFKSKR